MAGGGEAGHVGARLGEDLLRGRDADAGISSSWATWAANGAMAFSIRVVSVSIWAVSASTRPTIMASRNA
jgi:hypothetical protein